MKHILSSSELLVSSTCAVLCDVIYRQERDPEGVLAEIKSSLGASPDGFEYISIPEISTEAYLVQFGGRIYLVFRGSESTRDWEFNVKFELSPWPLGGHCHSGFLDVVRKSSKSILPKLEKRLASEGLEFVVTGHSLGGAMAQLYCALIVSELPSVHISQLVTFGQPRVGNQKFCEWFSSLEIDHLRFVNEGDAVADAPPPLGKHNWFHSGVPILFSSSGSQDRATEDSDASIWKRLLNYVGEYLDSQNQGRGSDYIELRKRSHEMGLYRKNVLNLSVSREESLKLHTASVVRVEL